LRSIAAPGLKPPGCIPALPYDWLSVKDISFHLNDPRLPSVSSHHRKGPGVYFYDYVVETD
jgi:hypothetical protein